MAYITPKTDWKAKDVPKGSDFNRIEGNIEYLNDELIPDSIAAAVLVETNARIADVNAEEAARIAADSTLQTNINTEASTRAGADNTLQININNEASARASADATLTSSKMTNAVIGNNGGIGSIVSITPSLVSGGVYRFTMPHSGVWLCPALTSSAAGFFSGSVFDVVTNASARTFWRIG